MAVTESPQRRELPSIDIDMTRDKSAGAGPIIHQLRWLGKEAAILPAPARPIWIGNHEKVKNFTVFTLDQDVEFKTDIAHVDRPGR